MVDNDGFDVVGVDHVQFSIGIVERYRVAVWANDGTKFATRHMYLYAAQEVDRDGNAFKRDLDFLASHAGSICRIVDLVYLRDVKRGNVPQKVTMHGVINNDGFTVRTHVGKLRVRYQESLIAFGHDGDGSVVE